MPPTLLVFLAILGLLGTASAVLFAALLLLVTRTTRRFSKPLALAMVGTLPFVLAYDLVAAVPVGIVLLTSWAFWKAVEPGPQSMTNNPWVIGVSICAALFALGTLLAASLAGVYDGWRTGWMWGRGQGVRSAISRAPIYLAFSERFQRRRRAGLDRRTS